MKTIGALVAGFGVMLFYWVWIAEAPAAPATAAKSSAPQSTGSVASSPNA